MKWLKKDSTWRFHSLLVDSEEKESGKQVGGWESLGVGFEDSVLEEAKRSWELEKSLGLSSPNEIDNIWAMSKDRRNKKRKEELKRQREETRKESRER